MRINLSAITLAASMIAAAALVTWLKQQHLVDADMLTRATQVLIGLVLVVMANATPKRLDPLSGSLQSEARRQAGRRFAGWSLSLGGLAYAGAWLFAPLELAPTLSLLAGATGLGLAVLYAAMTCWAKKPA